MKLAASIVALAGSAAAFAPSQSSSRAATSLSLTVRRCLSLAALGPTRVSMTGRTEHPLLTHAHLGSFLPYVSQKDTLPGALAPVGFFDPLGFADDADENTLKRYREAELTHGRVVSTKQHESNRSVKYLLLWL